MSEMQRLILEDGDNTYDVFVEATNAQTSTGSDPYNPDAPRGGISKGWSDNTGNTIPPEIRVQLQKVHKTIQGYTQYTVGAFKNLAGAEVEELNLKFNLKISAESGMPMLASAKTEADFAIEVKCKFPESKEKN